MLKYYTTGNEGAIINSLGDQTFDLSFYFAIRHKGHILLLTLYYIGTQVR